MIHVTATTRSGLMPDRSARSSLSEKARIDLPVRVRFRNQKSAATTTIAVTMVMACVDLKASPSARPVIFLNSPAVTTNRSPSSKRISSTPMMKRVTPFMMNITPMETMTRITGAAFCRR